MFVLLFSLQNVKHLVSWKIFYDLILLGSVVFVLGELNFI